MRGRKDSKEVTLNLELVFLADGRTCANAGSVKSQYFGTLQYSGMARGCWEVKVEVKLGRQLWHDEHGLLCHAENQTLVPRQWGASWVRDW